MLQKICQSVALSSFATSRISRGMAEILAKTAGIELKMDLPTEAEKKAFNPMSNSSLDSRALLALGWKGLFDAERGFSHTVKIIRDIE